MNIAEVTELAAADSHTRDTLVDEGCTDTGRCFLPPHG